MKPDEMAKLLVHMYSKIPPIMGGTTILKVGVHVCEQIEQKIF